MCLEPRSVLMPVAVVVLGLVHVGCFAPGPERVHGHTEVLLVRKKTNLAAPAKRSPWRRSRFKFCGSLWGDIGGPMPVHKSLRVPFRRRVHAGYFLSLETYMARIQRGS